MNPTKTQLWYEACGALVVAIAVYFAFRFVGFFGVGTLGVLIMFVAFQIDLTKNGTSSTFSIIPLPPHRMDHAERAARRAEAESLAQPVQIMKLLGLCLAVIGFAAFFFV